jgi:hypothetical protein
LVLLETRFSDLFAKKSISGQWKEHSFTGGHHATPAFLCHWIEMENGQAVNNLSAYYDKKSTPVQKAYKNPAFLNSGQARNIRILCELEVRVAFFKKRN